MGCERIQRNEETIPGPQNHTSAKPPPPATSGSDHFGPKPKTILRLAAGLQRTLPLLGYGSVADDAGAIGKRCGVTHSITLPWLQNERSAALIARSGNVTSVTFIVSGAHITNGFNI